MSNREKLQLGRATGKLDLEKFHSGLTGHVTLRT
jgi:hypothetical protein